MTEHSRQINDKWVDRRHVECLEVPWSESISTNSTLSAPLWSVFELQECKLIGPGEKDKTQKGDTGRYVYRWKMWTNKFYWKETSTNQSQSFPAKLDYCLYQTFKLFVSGCVVICYKSIFDYGLCIEVFCKSCWV